MLLYIYNKERQRTHVYQTERMFDQNQAPIYLPNKCSPRAAGATHPGVSMGAGNWSWTTPPGVSGDNKKKKKILPLLLYHTLLPKVKSFLKNFLKKFSQFLLTFASGYDIIEERVQIKKNGGRQSPLPPNLLLYHRELGKVKYFYKIFLEIF